MSKDNIIHCILTAVIILLFLVIIYLNDYYINKIPKVFKKGQRTEYVLKTEYGKVVIDYHFSQFMGCRK